MPRTLKELREMMRRGLDVKDDGTEAEPESESEDDDMLDLLSDFKEEPGEPTRKSKGLDVDKMRRRRRHSPADRSGKTTPRRYGSRGKYKLSADGSDAMLLFGKFNGGNVSDIARKEPGYLRWMLGEDFAKELKDVIEHILGISYDEVAVPVDEFMKKRRHRRR
ncbi:MAG: hypothetical protein ACWGQW_00820 [bacterium]